MNRAIVTSLCAAILAAPPTGSTHPMRLAHSVVKRQAQAPTRVKGRALLVGINQYKNFPNKPTPGSEEDAIETKPFIIRQYGFHEDEVRVLLGPQATADRIVNEFRDWLIAKTQPGDRVFFLYSGHGTRVKDDNGDEEDGKDEALAPYDVDQEGKNIIRDDVFNQLLGELSGRMVVMVFDSCHSGSISRGGTGDARNNQDTRNNANPKYLPSPEEFAELAKASGAPTRSGGNSMVDYVVEPLKEQDAKSRDLNLVVDRPQIKNTGIVIFSAAHSGQQAFPVEIKQGQFRGALSYAFNESQSADSPILSELKRRITAGIAAMQSSGKLNRRQQPAFEVFSGDSRVSLEDQPLYGAAQMAQVLAEGNPGSEIKLELQVEPDQRAFSIRKKDPISYKIKSNTDGYLYLLVFSEENKATCLFPNPDLIGEQKNYVPMGTHRVPLVESESYEAKKPIGKDIVIALLSKSKLRLGEKEDYTWDEIFERLRSSQFFEYVKTRGQGVAGAKPLRQADWQVVSLVLETIE